MAQGKPGADSSVIVTSQIGGKGLIRLATDLFGEPPVFWGRYFTTTSGTNAEYRHLKENRALRRAGIRVLPIARQTKRVSGTLADGSVDAAANAEDVIVTFGTDYLASQGGEFFVFLDVEGAPPLSGAYYTGWAQTLTARSADLTDDQVRLLPCVYATHGDSATWSAVAATMAAGVECRGVWVARWLAAGGCQPLQEWDDQHVTPDVPLSCPVLIWQYSDDCHGGGGFDCSQINPAIDLDNDLRAHLILPPQ